MTESANKTALRLVPAGRRELNKRDKLERIRRASRDVFLEKGFEAATIREIADRAEVAFGTVFLYAKDKADLLLLLFDEELDALTDRAFAQNLAGRLFIDQLMIVFEEFYKFFLVTPSLSRDMMREAAIFNAGVVGKRLLAGLHRTEGRLAELVAANQAEGKVTRAAPPDMIAQFIFMIYRAEIRIFLSDENPKLANGLQLLRQNLTLLFNGLKA